MFYTLMKRRKELEKVRREAFEKARGEAREKAFHEGFDEGRRDGLEADPQEFSNEGSESNPEGAQGEQSETKPSEPLDFVGARGVAAEGLKDVADREVFLSPQESDNSNPVVFPAPVIGRTSFRNIAGATPTTPRSIESPYVMHGQWPAPELYTQIYESLMNKKPFRIEYDVAGNPRFVDISSNEQSVVQNS